MRGDGKRAGGALDCAPAGNPAVLQASMEMYKAIMFGPSGLTRQERELLATVVSAENECFY